MCRLAVQNTAFDLQDAEDLVYILVAGSGVQVMHRRSPKEEELMDRLAELAESHGAGSGVGRTQSMQLEEEAAPEEQLIPELDEVSPWIACGSCVSAALLRCGVC